MVANGVILLLCDQPVGKGYLWISIIWRLKHQAYRTENAQNVARSLKFSQPQSPILIPRKSRASLARTPWKLFQRISESSSNPHTPEIVSEGAPHLEFPKILLSLVFPIISDDLGLPWLRKPPQFATSSRSSRCLRCQVGAPVPALHGAAIARYRAATLHGAARTEAPGPARCPDIPQKGTIRWESPG